MLMLPSKITPPFCSAQTAWTPHHIKHKTTNSAEDKHTNYQETNNNNNNNNNKNNSNSNNNININNYNKPEGAVQL